MTKWAGRAFRCKYVTWALQDYPNHSKCEAPEEAHLWSQRR
jgi:hypothetical protein